MVEMTAFILSLDLSFFLCLETFIQSEDAFLYIQYFVMNHFEKYDRIEFVCSFERS